MLERFSTGLLAMGLAMPMERQTQCLQYLELMRKWNTLYNLTAIKDMESMLTHHLLDSLAIAPYLHSAERVIDVGTGAGLPGIPLALYYPNTQFTLLDSIGKKTRFIQQVKAELHLENVTVVNGRMEEYQTVEKFDVIIFRAVKAIRDIIHQTAHLCADKGQYYAMKGTYPSIELEGLTLPYLAERISVPGLNAERHLVRIQGGDLG